MKFGVNMYLLRAQQTVEVAQKVEALGFDSVWLGEHVITPAATQSEFPYSDQFDDSHAGFNHNIPFFDAYTALAYVAAKTSTLKLGVAISIVPLHDPFNLARQVATLDIFSGGRFVLGIGTGWVREEFEIMGVDFAGRGKRLEEMLEILVSLFNNDLTTYDGEHFKIPPIGLNPKPDTRPHPPFFFGGHAKAALRRAALYGDGWTTTAMAPDALKEIVQTLKALRAEAGRDGPFEITCTVANGGKDLDREMIERYREAGADRLIVSPWNRGREAVDGVTRFAETLF